MARTNTSQARRWGRQAGEAAASWLADQTQDGARRLLGMIDAGDPAADQWLPAEPNLSGEWADSETPQTLAASLGLDDEDDRVDGYCSAWEEASGAAYWRSIYRQLRRLAK